MSKANAVESHRQVLPWETVKLITIVFTWDACQKMKIRELAEEADFLRCRGKLAAQNKNRRAITNRIIKATLKRSFNTYIESAKKGHVENNRPIEHAGYLAEMRERGLKAENFNW